MSTIFIGGSRHVSRLPPEVIERLNNIATGGHKVVVGDAAGADKAVQKFFADISYEGVTVFCSGDKHRNNLGQWPTRKVLTDKDVKGFQFYAAKDRAMALEADFGLMIWDGKSPGTILNVLRLIRVGKKVVLFDLPESRFITFRQTSDWDNFIAPLSQDMLNDLRERATEGEWIPSAAIAQNSACESGDKQSGRSATVLRRTL